MTTPDLPPELWLEILAYFSPGFVVKLMGVNRLLFELALQYIYEEVQLTSDDKPALTIFTTLRYGKNAPRVQRLFIRPTFLPGPDEVEDALESQPRGFRHAIAKEYRKLLHIARPPSPGTLPPSPENHIEEVLQASAKSLADCINLREVTIIIHDLVITASFSAFLDTLWNVVGDRLEKITIQTTLAKIPGFLEAIVKKSSQITNLKALDLTVVNSRLAPLPDHLDAPIKAIVKFASHFKDTLTHLSLSTLIAYDLSPLFEKLGELPLKLNTFELRMIMCGLTLSRRASLADFLYRNHNTLDHLILMSRPRFDTFFPEQDTLHNWIDDEFTKIQLPNVTTLDLGITRLWSRFVLESNNRLSKLAPDVLPNLRKFSFKYPIPSSTLKNLLSLTGPNLEELDVFIEQLTPVVLDQLVKMSPNLRSLDLSYYDFKSSDPSRPHGAPVATYREGVVVIQFMSHYGSFSEGRSYPNWPLRRIRAGRRAHCGEMHPDLGIAKAIERMVGRHIEKDDECLCFCHRSEIDRM